MGYATEARDVLAERKTVPFRRRQHIGKKLQAKIREMATTGILEQYRDLLAQMPEHRRELMTLPGVGPGTADRLYRTLGIATAAELVRAARDGRLRTVRGFGPKRTAILAALDIPGVGDGEAWNLFNQPV
jgi:DNA polymerase/3'-5' exonuclease PolX